MKDMTYGDLE